MKLKDLFATNQLFALIAKGIDGLKIIVINVLVARMLGPEIYGNFAYVIGIISLVAILAEYRIQSILIKELSVSAVNDQGTLISSALVLNSIFAVVGILCILIVSVFEVDQNVVEAMILCSLGYLFNIPRFFRSLFISREKNSLVATSESVASIGVVFFLWLFLTNGFDWIYLPFVRMLDFLMVSLSFLLLYILYIRSELPMCMPRVEVVKSLIIKSTPMVLSGVAMILFQRMDLIMIKNMLGSESAGYYSAASTYMMLFGLIPMVLSESLAPKMIRNFGKGTIQRERYVLWIMLVGAILSGVCFFSGLFFIPWLYGAEYSNSLSTHVILSICPVLVAAGSAAGQLIVADDSQGKAFYKSIAGCIVNFILNLLLIPEYGLPGAAVATVIGFLVANWVGHIFFREYRYIFNIQIKVFMPWKAF